MAIFGVRFIEESAGAGKRVVIVAMHEHEEKTICKLYSQANQEAYRADLERNFTMVVELDVIAGAISTTLNMYYKLNRLNDESYHHIMEMFIPVIKTHMKWESVKTFLAGPREEDWV
ncbi:hypothetical protein D3C87_1016790 [compost metagenome]